MIIVINLDGFIHWNLFRLFTMIKKKTLGCVQLIIVDTFASVSESFELIFLVWVTFFKYILEINHFNRFKNVSCLCIKLETCKSLLYRPHFLDLWRDAT